MDSFYGEIRAFPFNYVPQGWYPCYGQLLNVSQNQVLFSIIGYRFGGSGQQFNLPDLRGTAVAGFGQGPGLSNWNFAAVAGNEVEQITSMAQLPAHNHEVTVEQFAPKEGTNKMTATPVAGKSWLTPPQQILNATTANLIKAFSVTGTPDVVLNSNALAPSVGNTASHENRQPYLPMIYAINWNGPEYPERD